jgi:hypothetical protein
VVRAFGLRPFQIPISLKPFFDGPVLMEDARFRLNFRRKRNARILKLRRATPPITPPIIAPVLLGRDDVGSDVGSDVDDDDVVVVDADKGVDSWEVIVALE